MSEWKRKESEKKANGEGKERMWKAEIPLRNPAYSLLLQGQHIKTFPS